MLWCNETLSILLAWGNEESAHDRLGRAISLSAETPLLDFCRVVMVIMGKQGVFGGDHDNGCTREGRERIR